MYLPVVRRYATYATCDYEWRPCAGCGGHGVVAWWERLFGTAMRRVDNMPLEDHTL